MDARTTGVIIAVLVAAPAGYIDDPVTPAVEDDAAVLWLVVDEVEAAFEEIEVELVAVLVPVDFVEVEDGEGVVAETMVLVSTL